MDGTSDAASAKKLLESLTTNKAVNPIINAQKALQTTTVEPISGPVQAKDNNITELSPSAPIVLPAKIVAERRRASLESEDLASIADAEAGTLLTQILPSTSRE